MSLQEEYGHRKFMPLFGNTREGGAQADGATYFVQRRPSPTNRWVDQIVDPRVHVREMKLGWRTQKLEWIVGDSFIADTHIDVVGEVDKSAFERLLEFKNMLPPDQYQALENRLKRFLPIASWRKDEEIALSIGEFDIHTLGPDNTPQIHIKNIERIQKASGIRLSTQTQYQTNDAWPFTFEFPVFPVRSNGRTDGYFYAGYTYASKLFPWLSLGMEDMRVNQNFTEEGIRDLMKSYLAYRAVN